MSTASLKDRCLSALQYPESNEFSIDSPEVTIRRWQIIREKQFLKNIYAEWYQAIAASLPANSAPVLEIGSGAGFMGDFVDNLITSDILQLPQIQMVLDACAPLPFADNSLRGVTMINTLHHLPDVEIFLQQASRCLKPGGVLAMVEPWVTTWSRFVYSRLHHEPFQPSALDWKFESQGPLSGANGALPWIVFQRDRARFGASHPELVVEVIKPMMPLIYILSGGVSMRSLVPGFTYGFWKATESLMTPILDYSAMFALVVVRKTVNEDLC